MKKFFSAIVPVTDVDDNEWDRTVCSLNGTVAHSFAWSRYMSAAVGKPFYFLVNRPSGTVAAGWYTLSGMTVGRRKIMKQVQMESLPCFNPEMITANEVVRTVRQMALSQKCVALCFGNSGPEYLGSLDGCTVAAKTSFTIDLRDPAEAIFSRFARQHRKRIRNAVKNGLRVEAFSGDAPPFIDELEAMYCYTYQRHVSSGKSRTPPKESGIREALYGLVVPGKAVLFAALLGDEPVSFTVAALFNGKARGNFQASSEKGYALSASYLLIRESIEFLKARGCRSLSIGEVPREAEHADHPDHGLYLYKSGYTRQTSLLCSGSLVLRPVSHAAVNIIKRGRSALIGSAGS